jgi:serralysin
MYVPVGGTAGKDVLSASGLATLIQSGAGADKLIGASGFDQLLGEADADKIWGYDGNDRLLGGDGADGLSGGKGRDVLIGGAGGDTMAGGKGNDIFQLSAPADSPGAGPDLIADLGDKDRIDLSAIDARPGKPGDQDFELVDAFTGRAGEAVLTYVPGEGRTHLELDVTGDGVADALILIDGDHSDFTRFVL